MVPHSSVNSPKKPSAPKVWKVALALEVGMVGVNTGKISAAEAPFGGIKESSLGKEGSMYGLAEFQIMKNITLGNLGM